MKLLSCAFLLISLQSRAQLLELVSGKIIFESAAELESIEATSTKPKGLVDLSKKNFAFSVDISTFDGFNSALQKEHFNENYLESNIFPTASFSGKLIDPVDLNKTKQTIRAKGKFTVHGISKERIINVDLKKTATGFEISSNFNVLLSDHGISIPRIVYQKIAENISVTITGKLNTKQ
ncbi:MAG: YceI family protein [Flavobacteriales bacterium]